VTDKLVKVAIPIPVQNTFTYALPADSTTVEPGSRVKVPFGRRMVVGYAVETTTEKPQHRLRPIAGIIDRTSLIPPSIMELVWRVANFYYSPLYSVLRIVLPPELEFHENVTIANDTSKKINKSINSSEIIIKDIKAGKPSRYLWYEIDKSSRLERYVALVKQVSILGKQVLLLIPEVFHIKKFAEQIAKSFDGNVTLWHSGLSKSKRQSAWLSATQKTNGLVIGTRSAIFLPIKNLGAIIIDDENDDSFKEQQTPMYQARIVSEWRSEIEHCPLIMGTSVPSFEVWDGVKRKKIKVSSMKQAPKPDLSKIKLVDLRVETAHSWKNAVLSRTLRAEIKRCLMSGERIILVLNRRGYATFINCTKCGYVFRCLRCDHPLNWHKLEQKLVCHICGARKGKPVACPKCGERQLKFGGVGIERVEQIVQFEFPDARIARLDSDTVKRIQSANRLVEDFRNGNVDILVGTGLVARDWELGKVGVVGLVSADTALEIPDWRANERTYSSLVVWIKKIGRGVSRLIIQTRNPENPAIRSALKYDYENFYDTEMKLRDQLNYPPKARLINVIIRSKDEREARLASRNVSEYIRQNLEGRPGIEIIGPYPVIVARLRGYWRWHVVLKQYGEIDTAPLACLMEIQDKFSTSNVQIRVDADPITLM